jgi:hypothetical protein
MLVPKSLITSRFDGAHLVPKGLKAQIRQTSSRLLSRKNPLSEKKIYLSGNREKIMLSGGFYPSSNLEAGGSNPPGRASFYNDSRPGVEFTPRAWAAKRWRNKVGRSRADVARGSSISPTARCRTLTMM